MLNSQQSSVDNQTPIFVIYNHSMAIFWEASMVQFSLVVAFFLTSSAVLLAQVTTANIVGTVKDASGGTIEGVTVQAKAVATNQVREGKTASDGSYILTNLPIGEYEVSFAASGFRTEVNEGITPASGPARATGRHPADGQCHGVS